MMIVGCIAAGWLALSIVSFIVFRSAVMRGRRSWS